ncbi:hypothetical protein LIQ05_10945, partial [Blautia glucerasea]|uniref:hypothetical protein n=1 Tax=Blautia glucerasea TaxID=536633 RepID=UPI001D006ECD
SENYFIFQYFRSNSLRQLIYITTAASRSQAFFTKNSIFFCATYLSTPSAYQKAIFSPKNPPSQVVINAVLERV